MDPFLVLLCKIYCLRLALRRLGGGFNWRWPTTHPYATAATTVLTLVFHTQFAHNSYYEYLRQDKNSCQVRLRYQPWYEKFHEILYCRLELFVSENNKQESEGDNAECAVLLLREALQNIRNYKFHSCIGRLGELSWGYVESNVSRRDKSPYRSSLCTLYRFAQIGTRQVYFKASSIGWRCWDRPHMYESESHVGKFLLTELIPKLRIVYTRSHSTRLDSIP
jgi:hypothetical protein